MTAPQLLVTFTVNGDSRVHVKGAARIKVDGRGGLTLYDAQSGAPELVSLGCLQTLTIRTLAGVAPTPAFGIQ
jgi:hypothetical protein